MLFGPPASGKGTQGRRLASELGLAYLTGALLREHVENGTALGLQAKPILDRGEYLPDGLMCDVIGDWLRRQTAGWVLDGFPRSLPQAETLDGWLAEWGHALDAALFLDVPFEELLERIEARVECPDCRWSGQRSQTTGGGRCPECGGPTASRDDDNEENFRSRHRQFEKLTLPVVSHYQRKEVLVSVDASRPKDEVTAELLARLKVAAED